MDKNGVRAVLDNIFTCMSGLPHTWLPRSSHPIFHSSVAFRSCHLWPAVCGTWTGRSRRFSWVDPHKILQSETFHPGGLHSSERGHPSCKFWRKLNKHKQNKYEGRPSIGTNPLIYISFSISISFLAMQILRILRIFY